jgi:hypothetical protein
MPNDDNIEDTRDPLRAAFEDYVPAPRDIVPKQPYTGTNEDLYALDGQTVQLSFWDRDAGRPFTENVIVTRPITTDKKD